MASTIVGNPALSGPQQIVSGWPYSGQNPLPKGGVQLRADSQNSGRIYIYLSGPLVISGVVSSGSPTVTSGSTFLVGGGLLDGMFMNPSDSYWIPKIGDGLSGSLSIYANCDAACSGQARLWWEIF